MIDTVKNKIICENHEITKKEAMALVTADLELLCTAAAEIRSHFCGNHFELCSIVNGKSGKCSENCKFCAQSTHYQVNINNYPMLGKEELLAEAVKQEDKGILRYAIVTSGRCLTDEEIDDVCDLYRYIRKGSGISLCASHGLLTFEQFQKLKSAGVTRYHNNLESSRRYFPNICTTHSYEDKITSIKAAQRAGLDVCSGGIIGLGEIMDDRIDMALDLRALQIRSVPINILNPIQGTPFANVSPLSQEELRRIVAIYRFILPDAALRLAGGRGLLADKGSSAFLSGSNAAISGDMLTTSGISTDTDKAMLKELGYEVDML